MFINSQKSSFDFIRIFTLSIYIGVFLIKQKWPNLQHCTITWSIYVFFIKLNMSNSCNKQKWNQYLLSTSNEYCHNYRVWLLSIVYIWKRTYKYVYVCEDIKGLNANNLCVCKDQRRRNTSNEHIFGNFFFFYWSMNDNNNERVVDFLYTCDDSKYMQTDIVKNLQCKYAYLLFLKNYRMWYECIGKLFF